MGGFVILPHPLYWVEVSSYGDAPSMFHLFFQRLDVCRRCLHAVDAYLWRLEFLFLELFLQPLCYRGYRCCQRRVLLLLPQLYVLLRHHSDALRLVVATYPAATLRGKHEGTKVLSSQLRP